MKKLLILGLVFLLLLSSAFAVGTAPDPADVLAYYPLENLSDTTGNGYTFTATGSPSTVSSVIDNGYTFNGVDQYLTSGLIPSSVIGSGAFTVAGWFYFNTAPTDYDRVIGFERAGASAQDVIYVAPVSGKIQLTGRTGTAGVAQIDSGVTISTGQWYFIAFSRSGTTAKLYVDSSTPTSSTDGEWAVSLFDTFRIAARAQTTLASFGDIRADEVSVYSVALTDDEIAYLYQSGSPASPQQYPFTPISSTPDTLTIQVKDAGNASNVNNVSVLWNGTTYTNTTGNTIAINISAEGGNINITHNFTVSANNYFPVSVTNWNLTNTYIANLTQYPFVSAYNSWTNDSISTFNATINGTLYQTTTGKIYTPINASVSVLVEAANYFDNSTTHDFTGATDFNASMHQSYITFNASQLITGASVNGNVTIGATTKETGELWNLAAGSYNATFTASGYFPKTETFTISALDNRTITFDNVGNSQLKLNATNLVSGAAETAFNITFWYNGTNLDNYTTTNGTIYVPVVQGSTFQVIVDDSLHAQQYFYITPDATYYNYTMQLATVNSVLLTFYDEVTGEVINGTNMTAQLIGANVYTYTTTNGSIYADLLTPSGYEIRYYSTVVDDYKLRSTFFELTPLSFNNISLYALNETVGGAFTTATITFKILDDNFNPVENAKVVVQRYYAEQNGFVSVFERFTDSNGNAVGTFETVDAFYKYLVYYNDELKYSSSNNGVQFTTTETYTIYITTTSNYGTSIQDITDLYNVTSLSFISTGNYTGYFEVDYTNPNNIQLCLNVTYSNGTAVGGSCQASSSGTIQQAITAPNDQTTVFVATLVGYDTTTEQYVVIRSGTKTFQVSDLLANAGLAGAASFIAALILTAIGLLLIRYPVVAILAQTALFVLMVLSPIPFVLGAQTTVAWVVSVAITATIIMVRGRNE